MNFMQEEIDRVTKDRKYIERIADPQVDDGSVPATNEVASVRVDIDRRKPAMSVSQ